MPTATTEILTYLKRPLRLSDSVENLRERYLTAKPFPYLVMDNLFSDEDLEALLQEIPSMEDEHWVHQVESRTTKSNLRSAVDLGEAGYQHAAFLHSPAFLYLIAELTNIWHVVPDPYLSGGGYHVIPKGGHFDVHADRNVDHNTGLTRRLAMLTYLNKEWKSEYGGQLELWSTDGSRCEVVVEPIFNRTILFEVADKNFHGVRPVEQDGIERKSFAIYLHTVGNQEGATPHNSVYLPNFYRTNTMLKRVVRDVTPPLLFRGLQKLRPKARQA